MSGGKHKNVKTGICVDFSTQCPLMVVNKACEYCYVEYHRGTGDLVAKTVIPPHRREYYNGWVLRLKRDTIDELNVNGGMRIFGSGDYFPDQHDDYVQLFKDAEEVGLQCKAVTKSLQFIREFHRFKALRIINLSVDNLPAKGMMGGPVSLEKARDYRRRYRKVVIRAVAVDWDDVHMYGKLPYVDILTLYHGNDKRFHNFNAEESAEIEAKYGLDRMCGSHFKCGPCPSKCGQPHTVAAPKDLVQIGGLKKTA